MAVGPIDDPAIEEVAAAPAAGAVEFATHAISTNIRGPHSVFAADVDGDGDLDVLGGFNNDNKIVWYENDGSENFTTHIISTNTDGISVLAADMDGDGNLDVLSALFFDNTIAWYENLSPIIPELPADLTGNGFVDFEDLTVLLANWNKDVSAGEGNLVDPLTTVVNFEDLTVLLAVWTGPGGAASPQAAAVRSDRIHAVGQDPINRVTTTVGRRLAAATVAGDEVRSDRVDAVQAVGRDPMNRVTPTVRRGKPAAYARNPLRRLQAAAVDRAMGDDRVVTRRSRRDRRSRLYGA